MIAFVDLKTGRIFNGEKPYIFWFEGGQSVNLNYVQRICVLSTYPIIKATIKSDTFWLLKMDQNIPILNDPDNPDGWAERINEKIYIDLTKLESENFISSGAPYNNFYVHMIYVLGRSVEAGEIHDSLYITDDDGTFEYEIAADFYAENEILKMNLDNFDVSIPESIQKAIYDTNVHEESNDNITLNRKYKELLMYYWDIVANKGSYNSLQNSLAWFEWGDLVRIEEFWKRHHEGMEDYFQTKLNTELSDEFIVNFLNNSKTTFIGLYMALSKTVLEDGHIRYQGFQGNPESPLTNPRVTNEEGVPQVGNYVYVRWEGDTPVEEDDLTKPGELIQITPGNADMFSTWSQQIIPNHIYEEPNPYLDPVVSRWGLLDLCLKMTLLGNFYSTYFTPIHIETLHSTLEQWVFSYAIKVLHTSGIDELVTVNNIRSFDMIYARSTKMRDMNCYNYSNTLFLSNQDVFGYERLRVSPDDPLSNDYDPNWENFIGSGEALRYHMGGMYGRIHFKVSEEMPILACDQSDMIVRQALSWSCNDRFGSSESFVQILPQHYERSGFRTTNWVFLPEFDLGFTEPGHYIITFEFDTLYGNIWTNIVEVDIEDNTRNHIDFYKVLPREDINTLILNDDDFNRNPVWLRSFQMNPGIDGPLPPFPTDLNTFDNNRLNIIGGDPFVRNYLEYKEHNIFFGQFLNGEIGLNHTVIFDIPNVESRVVFNIIYDDGNLTGISRQMDGDLDTILQYIRTNFPDYIWISQGTFPPFDRGSHPNKYHADNISNVRFVGIRRQFGNNVIDGPIITGIEMTNLYNPNIPIVSSYRFHPFLYRLEPLNRDLPINTTDLIYMVPVLAHSRDLEITNWEFENKTTGEKYTSNITERTYEEDTRKIIDEEKSFGGMMGGFIAPQSQVELNPGYYSIKLDYIKGQALNEFEMNSAFIMERNNG